MITKSRIRQIVELIDLTNLADDCSTAAIEQLCADTITPVGSVAAVCVWPDFVKDAKQHLKADSEIAIATVINFPQGTEPLKNCIEITETAIADGATEIDYVMPYTQLLEGNTGEVEFSLKSMRDCIPRDIHLKVILETGELKLPETIRSAATLAIDHGADFIKTSTGKVATNATLNAAEIMLEVIATKNSDVGFKPAGGISTVSDADAYLRLAERKLGESWLNKTHFRIGASSLLQDALQRL